MEHVWDGVVTNVWNDGDTFTTELRRDGAPDLIAEFSMRECQLADIEPGSLLIVRPGSVVKRELPVWTQEEIDDIRRRAKIRAARLGFLAD